MSAKAQHLFDTAKIQLVRLNEDWSLSGDTFCHQTASIIRSAVWSDRDEYQNVYSLQRAVAHLARRFADYTDPDSGPCNTVEQSNEIARWSNTFAAASDTVSLLEDTLPDKQRELLANETMSFYRQLF
jgi:hypothetical protein